jgi:hypothetical protein
MLTAVSLSIALLSAGYHVLTLLSLLFTVYFALLRRAWDDKGEAVGEREVVGQQTEEEKGKEVDMRPVSVFFHHLLFCLIIYLTAKT